MRWTFLVAFALTALAAFAPRDASAQSLQCLQIVDRIARNDCANRDMDDLRDRVRYWRRAARQTEDEYAYFENARASCRGEPACIAREFQIEMSELQVKLTPAQAARVPAYPGPVIYELEGGPNDLTRSMDAIIMQDSRGWWMNSYDRGSARNVHIMSQSANQIIVHAQYTYNRGQPGWVRARIVGREVDCLTYHDYPSRCRPWGASSYAMGDAASTLGQIFIGAVIQNMLTPR